MDVPPILLLIRPERQSKQLLSECEAALGSPIETIISPIIQIAAADQKIDISPYRGVIVTSVNAVRHSTGLAGKRLYCVGKRTGIAALKADSQVVCIEPDSKSLIARMLAERPTGPLIFLRGEHVTTNIAKDLTFAGLETDSAVVYSQKALSVKPVMQQAIKGAVRAVLPLYSPRSAYLLGKKVERRGAGLHVIAISDAVAKIWEQEAGGDCEVCHAPDAVEMIGRIVAGLRADST